MRSELNRIANELTDLAEKYEEASKTIHVWDEKDWDSWSNACNEADKEFDGRYFISGLTPVEAVKYLTSIISVLSKPKEEKQTLDYETMRQEFRNPALNRVETVRIDDRFFNFDLARAGLEVTTNRARVEVEPATPPNEWDLDAEEEERDELELQDAEQPDQDEDQF